MLTEKIENLEQQAHQYNLENINILDKRNEGLIAIIRNLGSVIHYPIDQTDILAVHRVPHANPSNSHPKNIVVKLSTRVEERLHIETKAYLQRNWVSQEFHTKYMLINILLYITRSYYEK
ncbi:hypothetical protein EVAR_101020_1 [Eumeta japonica]|uniref:Uncharacterized protein n=1 Tax=Eumeta variegata TaxID=151549 RepID=A0A4C2ADP2_EUMVA|nr:hypothetical protein EVAR_101020_1 [Eumeta japonica]